MNLRIQEVASSITSLENPGGTDRASATRRDRIFEHTVGPVGPLVLEAGGEIIATGSALARYNPPFADIFMEVSPNHRRKGGGSFLVQEVIKACYLEGRVPAARCDVRNAASRATLTKAGPTVCGFMLLGEVRPWAAGVFHATHLVTEHVVAASAGRREALQAAS